MAAPIPLWPKSNATDPADIPTLTPFLIDKPVNGGLVIVCPGGGYGGLADHEGRPIAEMLNAAGIHAAVLKYRLGPRHRHPSMLNDAQRAIRLVRHHAAAWKVNPKHVGILGFSAGGHLTSTAAVHYDRFTCPNDDLAATISARPDVAVLCYPVIDMAGEFRHEGSKNNLLGPNPDPALVAQLSNHTQVTPQTPPCFLWHTADDDPVPVQNSLQFVAACRKNRVPVELHVFESGRHGLGLAPDHPAAAWATHCAAFLHRQFAKG